MAIIPWKPFGDVDRFFENDDWMPLVSEISKPVMDLYETDSEIVAEVNAPGVKPEDIEVSVEHGVLRVSGKTEEEKEEKEKDYWRKEIRKGSFERAIRLPAPVDEEKIDATYDDGVLRVVMPKVAQEVSRKKIEVKKK